MISHFLWGTLKPPSVLGLPVVQIKTDIDVRIFVQIFVGGLEMKCFGRQNPRILIMSGAVFFDQCKAKLQYKALLLPILSQNRPTTPYKSENISAPLFSTKIELFWKISIKNYSETKIQAKIRKSFLDPCCGPLFLICTEGGRELMVVQEFPKRISKSRLGVKVIRETKNQP